MLTDLYGINSTTPHSGKADKALDEGIFPFLKCFSKVQSSRSVFSIVQLLYVKESASMSERDPGS